jgi:CRISPR-associated endonuclease Cas2
MSKNDRKLYYKGVRVNSFGIPILNSSKKDILKEKQSKRFYNVSFQSPFTKSSAKDLVIMYDVSDDKKKERDWLRRHLIKFGYVMIQRSVWVGPSPLSKEFLSYLKEIKIGDNLKILKLSKPYDAKNKIL